MIRLPPISTRTATLVPHTTLVRSSEAMEGSRTPAAAPGGAATTNAQSSEAAGEAPRTEDPPPRPIDELLADLDELVGLDGVKHEVKLVTNLLRLQKLRLERRSEERRVGKEGVSTCRSRWSPYP